MTEYTPTTKEVRLDWECFMSEGGASRESLEDADWDPDKRAAQFDRWLNEIRAEAWDEGRQAEELGWTHAWDGHPAEPDEFCDECKVENPYRNPAE